MVLAVEGVVVYPDCGGGVGGALTPGAGGGAGSEPGAEEVVGVVVVHAEVLGPLAGLDGSGWPGPYGSFSSCCQ